MKLSNKTYDALKWVCLIALPALNTFLLAVLPISGVPVETVKVVVTIVSAVATFIGTLIGISTAQYTAEAKDDHN